MMKQKKRIRTRPGRPVKTTEKGGDPINQLTERQDGPYESGYYAGRNIDPLFIPWRPNKYGYLLIVAAIMLLIVVVLGVRARVMDWYAVTIAMAGMLFMFLVGFKLIKKQPTPETGAMRRRSKLDD